MDRRRVASIYAIDMIPRPRAGSIQWCNSRMESAYSNKRDRSFGIRGFAAVMMRLIVGTLQGPVPPRPTPPHCKAMPTNKGSLHARRSTHSL